MKNDKVIPRIENEIEKIDKKESNVFFFVLDTKGNPNGSLSYIYNLAMKLNNNGYKVGMLYQEDDEFIGVKDWMGEEFANLPHFDISSGDVSVSASDILFIPEIFSNVMIKTKNLPCKRIAILQNYNYLLEQMPISSQWWDLGITECVTNGNTNAELINSIFPYVKTNVVKPFINKMFGETNEPKKMIINVVSRDPNDIMKVIKPFYWKYPMYKWVSFRELRGHSQDDFSVLLREGAITIWLDEECGFGYSALEAMKSGSIVIAKVTEHIHDWMKDKDGNLKDCCIWFENYDTVHKLIASVVRSVITDKIPNEIKDAVNETLSEFSEENTEKEILEYIDGVLNNRKEDMKSLITYVQAEKEE